ncbi:glycoside hydrolase family 113 [Streptacidiphilus sp. PAMC 29251]
MTAAPGRLSRALAAVLLLALTAAGCSSQLGKYAHADSGPTAAPTPTSTVATPWKQGRPQLGIQVYWGDSSADSDSTLRLKADRMIAYVTSLDANSISLSFPFHTPGPHADTVAAGSDTPSPRRLDIVVQRAKAAGLRITLRPLLDETTLVAAGPNQWRGSLQPADRTAWFASYTRFLTPYLALAQRDGVQSFAIGSEFSSLQGDKRWAGLVRSARAVYRGELTYAANWDSYVDTAVGVPVDRIGVDAYPPLKKLGDNAGIAQLVAGWNSWLDRKTSGPLPDSLFYEVGAPAEKGAYQHPGVWGNNADRLDLTVQQNWFKAACQVARGRDMAGLYWWRYDLHQDPAAADPLHDRTDSWVGRPAADAIRSCFAAWAAAAN